MYVPTFFKRRTGQVFLIGLATGAVMAYLIFIFMYGLMYERLLEKNLALQKELIELNTRNDALLRDKHELDKQEKKRVTVQSIDLSFENPGDFKIDKLMLHQFNDLLVKEISHIIGQDVQTLSDNDLLLISTIENKRITLTEFTYSFTVTKLIISEQVKITLTIKLAK